MRGDRNIVLREIEPIPGSVSYDVAPAVAAAFRRDLEKVRTIGEASRAVRCPLMPEDEKYRFADNNFVVRWVDLDRPGQVTACYGDVKVERPIYRALLDISVGPTGHRVSADVARRLRDCLDRNRDLPC